MIIIDMKAHAQCTEEGCTETMPVDLVLLTGGGFGFRATRPGWQAGHRADGPFGSPYLARCPKHARQVGIVKDLSTVRNITGVH